MPTAAVEISACACDHASGCRARGASLDRPRYDEDLDGALSRETAAVLGAERHAIAGVAAGGAQVDARRRGSGAELERRPRRIDWLRPPAQIERRKLVLEIAREADEVGRAGKQDRGDVGRVAERIRHLDCHAPSGEAYTCRDR